MTVECKCDDLNEDDVDTFSESSFNDVLLSSCIAEGSENVPFFTERNKHYWFINTVYWTSVLEDLGIDRASKLGQLIVRLVDHARTPAVKVFETLETLLGDDPSIL